jgi:hypothetical protein
VPGRRTTAERAAIARAKGVLDGLDLYPRPVETASVRLLHWPWVFRLPFVRRFAGYAVGPLVLLRRPLARTSDGLIAHELCHVWQWQHRGLRMWASYLTKCYRDNPHEVEARRAAAAAARPGA